MRIEALAVALSACVRASRAAECSAACSSEFVDNCITFGSNTYTSCRNQLDSSMGPLANVCTSGCTDTAAMAALDPNAVASPSAPPAVAGSFLATGTFYISQSGISRPVHVAVPLGDGPFPLQFLFHGRGGTGSMMLNQLSSLDTAFIKVAPDGYLNSWNIVEEESTLDDVAFIGLILDFLAARGNVNVDHVQLYGSSNGAALVNRILIESVDARILRAVTDVSQLNDRQYRGGQFYIGGASNEYSTVQPTLVCREIMSLQGALDTVIPAGGGPGLGGALTMNSDDDSIYAYAKAYGYEGAQLNSTVTSAYELWSYLEGAVSSYTLLTAGHGVLGHDAYVDAAVDTFLARGPNVVNPGCDSTNAPPPPPSSPPSMAPSPPPPAADATTGGQRTPSNTSGGNAGVVAGSIGGAVGGVALLGLAFFSLGGRNRAGLLWGKSQRPPPSVTVESV